MALHLSGRARRPQRCTAVLHFCSPVSKFLDNMKVNFLCDNADANGGLSCRLLYRLAQSVRFTDIPGGTRRRALSTACLVMK